MSTYIKKFDTIEEYNEYASSSGFVKPNISMIGEHGDVVYNEKIVSLEPSTTITENDVNFYDYDGTLVASCTKEEALAITELPALPDRTSENLTNEGWNWTLTEIKEQLNDVGGVVNVGCTYYTTDGKTHIFVDIDETTLDFQIRLSKYQASGNDVIIDWGDGTTTTVSSTSYNIYTHTYSTTGLYDVSIAEDYGYNTGNYIFGDSDRNRLYNCIKILLGNNHKSTGFPYFIRETSIPVISIPNSYAAKLTGTNLFYENRVIKHITLPKGVTTLTASMFSTLQRTNVMSISIPPTMVSFETQCFTNRNIKSITIPKGCTFLNTASSPSQMSNAIIEFSKVYLPSSVITIPKYCFANEGNLEYVNIKEGTATIDNYAFQYTNLRTITIPSTVSVIGSAAFQRCYSMRSMYFKSTTPPAIQSDTFVMSGASRMNPLVKIYVPRNSVNAYKTATNWSDIADHIYPYDYDAIPDALYFYMPNGGDITLTKTGSPTVVTLEYSLDCGATWTTWVESNNVRTLTLTAGQTMFVRNTSETSTRFSVSTSDYYQFGLSNYCYAGGKVYSLLCKDVSNAVATTYCFRSLFRQCHYLLSMPILSPLNNTSAIYCYYTMFYECDLLEETSLLPDEILHRSQCTFMFRYCSSLKTIKVLFTDISAADCLSSWVESVAANGDFYCPAELTIPTGSINGIPTGWTRHNI